ncbi:uroplakin-1b [Hyla sarda]|uniref:uroplakin-1b n=1 Tax=Hyla sarda TaxID=327740 RepID=UPI0024C24DDD|nr:uroplakin-1b [Hyla sarda]XP_056416920.1 uroplakin-1b [Hyla sarda]XP_056416921.1 uroplakin-1b [Hyla sarda]XP_056416922.1 uroplakin-1b [Hyla sarda]
MSGNAGIRCFQVILIIGNVVIGLAGLALTAECIYFVSDQNRLYPLLDATYNDDIYAAAWIGIFTGFCFFLLAILGIVGVMKCNRRMLMAYLILMFIVYCFEAASAIVAATQRDFFIPNLFLKQMLEYYQNQNPSNSDEQFKINGVTTTWNYLMLQKQCCGVNGPQDWQDYTSAFRLSNSDSAFPWPQQCCVMNFNGEPLDLAQCRLGVSGYLNLNGCYDQIAGHLNRHAWGVAWFGFAILCWAFWVLLATMFYWVRIEY